MIITCIIEQRTGFESIKFLSVHFCVSNPFHCSDENCRVGNNCNIRRSLLRSFRASQTGKQTDLTEPAMDLSRHNMIEAEQKRHGSSLRHKAETNQFCYFDVLREGERKKKGRYSRDA